MWAFECHYCLILLPYPQCHHDCRDEHNPLDEGIQEEEEYYFDFLEQWIHTPDCQRRIIYA